MKFTIKICSIEFMAYQITQHEQNESRQLFTKHESIYPTDIHTGLNDTIDQIATPGPI